MNVLSLFDGCSCAMIALDRAGIPVEQYFASEIDKYAIQVSKANWPDIIHIGDVTKVSYFEGVLYTEFGQYKVSFAGGMICGGSPCQGFSFAGKQLNFEDPRSKLFFEFVRIYEEIKLEHPDVKVFLENVMMKKEYQAVISKALGMECIMINSALVSAQNRKRLYWTNIPFQGQPTDRGILLKDILIDARAVLRWQNKKQGAVIDFEKSATLCASDKTGLSKIQFVIRNKFFDTEQKIKNFSHNQYATTNNGRISSLSSIKDNGIICNGLFDTGEHINQLTMIESERLQGVPDDYSNCVSKSQRYRMLGNGWNVDTIVHLFEPLLYGDIL